MNRRSFLRMLGLAPVAAVVPAVAIARAGTVDATQVYDDSVALQATPFHYPGKIKVSGAMTCSEWRTVSKTTRIAGAVRF